MNFEPRSPHQPPYQPPYQPKVYLPVDENRYMDYILIPFISFKLENGKKVWIDAFFTKKLSEDFRMVSLIRGTVKGEDDKNMEIKSKEGYKLEKILKPSEVGELISKTLESLNSQLEHVKSERGKSYAKWNLLRVLFVPFGWSKRIKEDEVKSGFQRELIYSGEILKALSSATPTGEIAYFKLEIVNEKPADKIYKRLYKIDSGFREAFDEIIKSK